MSAIAMNLAIEFRQPPRDAVAQHPTALLIGSIVLAAVVVPASIWFVWRSRDRVYRPVYFWSAVSGFTLYPLLVEPFGDYFVHVWYPANNVIAATVFDRPMPLAAVFGYGCSLPIMTIISYEIARRFPAKTLAIFLMVFGASEVVIEAIGNHFQWMIYYANPATILGVPIYCITQNGGFLAGIAWLLAWQLPKTRGWRWALIPVTIGLALPVWALVTTWPAYLAIHLGASDGVIWTAAAISTVLNAALVVACAYSPQLRRLREDHRRTEQPATASAATDLTGVS
jgi:hypothetical protein